MEGSAPRGTGGAFYVLAAGLAVTAVYNLSTGQRPTTTVPGLIISILSMAAMWGLLSAKPRVGRALDSAPILAAANCTLACIYVSAVLLGASLVYQVMGIGFVDSLGPQA